MEYRVSIEVNKPISLVSSHYLHQKMMLKWIPNLVDIISTRGVLFNQGSEGYLMFQHEGQSTTMKVSVIKDGLPDHVTVVYEVLGAYNKCINTFEKMNDHQTMWHMDVYFKFENDIDVPKKTFFEKTKKSMLLYKEFIEHE